MKDALFGSMILTLCGVGCGGLFYGIGIWAQKPKTPMHFWAGTDIDPSQISDIISYNQANARMWKCYSIPYWLSGLAGIGVLWSEGCSVLCLGLLVLAGTVGIWWLIQTYRRIWDCYSIT